MNSTRNSHFLPRQTSQPISSGITDSGIPSGGVSSRSITNSGISHTGVSPHTIIHNPVNHDPSDEESNLPKASFSFSARSFSERLQRLLAPLLRSIFNLKDRINRSKLIDNAFVQRIDALLVPLFKWTRVSRLLDGLSQFAHATVAHATAAQGSIAQGNQPLKQESFWNLESHNARNQNAGSLSSGSPASGSPASGSQSSENSSVSTATRLGFVSITLALLVGGWLWVSGPGATATSSLRNVANGAQADDGSGLAAGSFAVVNPSNVDATSTPAGESSQTTGVNNESGNHADSARQPLAVIAAAMNREPSNVSSAAPSNVPSNADSALPNIAQLANAGANSNNQVGTQVKDLITNALTVSNGPGDSETGSGENGPKTIAQIAIAQRSTGTPTPTPTITPTPTEEQIPLDVPQVRLIPMLPFPSALPADTATPTPTITPTPLPIEPGSLWSTFIPGPPSEVDHFWLGRPFLPTEANQLASANYQFGSTANGRYRMHHGLDMSNPLGTPVLATTDGEVIHAGIDDPVLLAPFANFYGNSVVIRLDRRLNIAGGDIDVFVLFGHLSTVAVEVGQRVSPQDVIGTIGMTGIAIGPHLHIEVRVGANAYDKSVNPYLWMQPREGRGAVAVRLLTADGRSWPGGRVSLIGVGGTSFSRTIEIYLDDEPLGPDPYFGENGAIGSVPPGNYVLAASVNGERVRKEIVVNAGETTFAEMRTQQ